MCSTRCRSSRHSPLGRQSSRRLQLEQVTSNFFWLWIGITAGTAFSPLVDARGARRNDLAHAPELAGLVEEAARAEPGGERAVRGCGEVRQQVEIDLGRLPVHGAQHLEAGAARQGQVEHHYVGPGGEDLVDRALR